MIRDRSRSAIAAGRSRRDIAQADAPDVDIAAVDQPAFLSGRAVAAPDAMGHRLIKPPRDAAG